MIEFDVDMGYLLEEGELDYVVLNDENGEHEPMRFVREHMCTATATLGDKRIKQMEKLIRAMYLDLLAEMPESLLEDRLIQMGELGIEVYGDDN